MISVFNVLLLPYPTHAYFAGSDWEMRYLPPNTPMIGGYGWSEAEADENGVNCIILSVGNPPAYNDIGPWKSEIFAERLALYVYRKMRYARWEEKVGVLNVPVDFWSSAESDPAMNEAEVQALLRYWVVLQGPRMATSRKNDDEPYCVQYVKTASLMACRSPRAAPEAAAVAPPEAPAAVPQTKDYVVAFLVLFSIATILCGMTLSQHFPF